MDNNKSERRFLVLDISLFGSGEWFKFTDDVLIEPETILSLGQSSC